MTVRRTPARRVGIFTIPETVTVSLDGLMRRGKRRVTAEDTAAIRELLDRAFGTYDDLTAAIETHCRETIEAHGGRRGKRPTPTTKGLETAGYFVPFEVKVEALSELDYALRVLWHLIFSRSNDPVEARRNALLAGALATEAAFKFRWEALALGGESALAQRRIAARAKAELAQQEARKWQAEVDARRPGSSKEAAYARIERSKGLAPGTVHKRLMRLRTRART